MIALIDSDVLLDVALQRKPWAATSNRVLDLAPSGLIQGFVSWHSVANIHYIARQNDMDDRLGFIRAMLRHLTTTTVGHADMLFALEQSISDFEDAMQVAAAIACRATRIVTRNTRDFRNSIVPAVTPAELLKEIGE